MFEGIDYRLVEYLAYLFRDQADGIPGLIYNRGYRYRGSIGFELTVSQYRYPG